MAWPAKPHIFTFWPFAVKGCPALIPSLESVSGLFSASVSPLSPCGCCRWFHSYHCGQWGFYFTLSGFSSLQSSRYLLFSSSSCLFTSTSPLFTAFVPYSRNIYFREFLLSSSASSFLSLSQAPSGPDFRVLSLPACWHGVDVARPSVRQQRLQTALGFLPNYLPGSK